MRCKDCRSYFVGDTALCPKCESKQFAAEAEQQAIKALKDVLHCLRFTFISNTIVLVALIAASIYYPPLLIITGACIAATIWWNVNVWREMRIWRVFKLLLKNPDQTVLKERIASFAPSGLCLSCVMNRELGDDFHFPARAKLGIFGTVMETAYRIFYDQVCTLRRFRNGE